MFADQHDALPQRESLAGPIGDGRFECSVGYSPITNWFERPGLQHLRSAHCCMARGWQKEPDMPTTIPGGSPALTIDSSTDRRRKKEFIALINDPEFIAIAIWAAVGILVAAFLTVYLPLSQDVALLSWNLDGAETKREALENGDEALLSKPIDFGKLPSKINIPVDRAA
jgi:hypothetical protein